VTRIAVIGASGQLGSDLVRHLTETAEYEISAIGHTDLNCVDLRSVEDSLVEAHPDCVVNCAAFVRVDDCEDWPLDAFSVNAVGALNVARAAAKLGAVCAYISTDYVFDGAKRAAYAEEDVPSPINVYGASKLAGEYFVRSTCPRHFILRSSGLYGVTGSSGKRGNFVETMIRLAREGDPIFVVHDQILTPTYTRDLSEHVVKLLRGDRYGLYHVTNSGQCSWYEFAAAVFELAGLKPELKPITTKAFGAKARRPLYSVLAHEKLTRVTLDRVRPWQEALEAYFRERRALAHA
jgi:dTDP-4-dehydrorhamnose reductase